MIRKRKEEGEARKAAENEARQTELQKEKEALEIRKAEMAD